MSCQPLKASPPAALRKPAEKLLIQAVDRRRCASCDCWRGERRPGETPEQVAVESETVAGLCVGGGWDNSERRARSACGHWRIWLALHKPDGTGSIR